MNDMDLLNDARRVLNQWPPQFDPPKWLSGFYQQWLPQLVMLLLVILIGQQAAHLTWRLVPLPPVQQMLVSDVAGLEPSLGAEQSPTELAKAVAELHLFGIAGAQKTAVRPVVDNKTPETNLKLSLHGVFAEEDPTAGAAIIGKSGSTQNYYQVGAEIMTGVKLQAVYRDRVVLSRDGRSEVLKFPKTVKPLDNLRSSPSSGKCEHARDFRYHVKCQFTEDISGSVS